MVRFGEFVVEIGLGQRYRINRAAGKKMSIRDFIGHQDFRERADIGFLIRRGKFVDFLWDFEGFLGGGGKFNSGIS